MQPHVMMILTGLIYLLLGSPMGMAFRYADWRNRQPLDGDRSFRRWWFDRMGSNIKSFGLAILLTGFIVEGEVLRKIPWVGSTSGLILAGPVGAIVTYYSHYLFSWFKRRAEEKTGPVDSSEEE